MRNTATVTLATLALIFFCLKTSHAEELEIAGFVASPSGEYVAYAKEAPGQVQSLWLRTRDGDRLLLAHEQLKKIHFAYSSTLHNMHWSPSERYLSFDIWDGDVNAKSVIYDLETSQTEPLTADEGNGYNAKWHPEVDVLFFKAGFDELQSDPTIYRYELSSGKKTKVHLQPGVGHHEPTKRGLVVLLSPTSAKIGLEKKFRKEIRMVRYSEFER